MKYRVHRYVSAATLRGFITRWGGPEFNCREFADLGTAVLVIEERRKVVAFTDVRQILSSIGNLHEQHRVAFCGNLTREAAELLAQVGFRILSRTKPRKKASAVNLTPFAEPVQYSSPDTIKNKFGRIKDWDTANKYLNRLDPSKRN